MEFVLLAIIDCILHVTIIFSSLFSVYSPVTNIDLKLCGVPFPGVKLFDHNRKKLNKELLMTNFNLLIVLVLCISEWNNS